MKQQGFTFIEFMIIFAIIGILAAIAFPAYEDYKDQASSSGEQPVQYEDRKSKDPQF